MSTKGVHCFHLACQGGGSPPCPLVSYATGYRYKDNGCFDVFRKQQARNQLGTPEGEDISERSQHFSNYV